MKNFAFAIVAVLVVGISSAQAVSISIDHNNANSGPGTSGSFDIIIDTAPGGETFANGGIDLAIANGTSGVIAYTGATVHEPTFFNGFVRRWAESGGVLVNQDGDDAFSLLRGLSLNTAGLDATVMDQNGSNADGGSDSSFLFATVNYDALAVGTTSVGLSPASGTDSFVNGGAVVDGVQLGGTDIRVVPEPTAMMLASLGLVGFVARRRRS